jgi:hypothetical protein
LLNLILYLEAKNIFNRRGHQNKKQGYFNGNRGIDEMCGGFV